MTDLELTKKIGALQWSVDLAAGTVESDLVRYRIISSDKYVDLQSVWISPDVPPVTAVVNTIQQGAVTAYQEAIKNA